MKVEAREVQANRYSYWVVKVLNYWRNVCRILHMNSSNYAFGEETDVNFFNLSGQTVLNVHKRNFIHCTVEKQHIFGRHIIKKKVSTHNKRFWDYQQTGIFHLTSWGASLLMQASRSSRREMKEGRIHWNLDLKKMFQTVVLLSFCKCYRSRIMVIIRNC